MSPGASNYADVEASIRHKTMLAEGTHGSYERVLLKDPDRPQSTPQKKPAWGGNPSARGVGVPDGGVPSWERCAARFPSHEQERAAAEAFASSVALVQQKIAVSESIAMGEW